MPAPTVYSESSLLGFMETEAGPLGEALGLLTSDALQQGVYAVERLLGVSDVSDATDMALVEAAARWETWRAVEAAALASPSKLESDGDKLDYSQQLDGIRKRLEYAESAYYTASAASGGSSVFAFTTIYGGRGR